MILSLCYNLPVKEDLYHEEEYQRVTRKYLLNPPEGMTSEDIRHMSEDDLLDMDYFLNEADLDDDFGAEGFYLF